MTTQPDEEALPRRGARIATPEGEWEVQEVMLLGRRPLHYAVRVLCPAVAGGATRLSVVLSRSEYLDLVAKARRPAPPADRGSRPGKLTRR